MMKRSALITLALVSVAPWALAQGTITNGNAVFILTGTPFDTTPTADFRGVSANLAQDHLFETGWWFRIQGDTQEFNFPTPTTQTYVGNTATISWTNVNGRGFDAQLIYTVTDKGGPSGTVRGDLTVNNPGASPLMIDIFNFVDFDVTGAGGDSGALLTPNNHIRITDTGGDFAEYRGRGANAFLVRPFGGTDVATVLSDAAVTNFDNSGLPFGPGDFTGGFQWTTTSIPAGGSQTYTVDLTVNYPFGQFFTVSPCRVIDTRNPAGPLGGPALVAGADRTFTIVGNCAIPAGVQAVSVNLAVTQPTVAGNLRLYPAGTPLPLIASINYAAGQTRSNNAIVPLSAAGDMTVRCAQGSGTAHFILDVNGYFE